MFWKCCLLEPLYKSAAFLKNKVAAQVMAGEKFPQREEVRGICRIKHADIVETLCAFMPVEKRAVWKCLVPRDVPDLAKGS